MNALANVRSTRISNAGRAEEHYLERLYGPVLGAPALWQVLGFASVDAFRKAAVRGVLPVATFTLPKRRGRFAHTHDVIRWLETVQAPSATPSSTDDLRKGAEMIRSPP